MEAAGRREGEGKEGEGEGEGRRETCRTKGDMAIADYAPDWASNTVRGACLSLASFGFHSKSEENLPHESGGRSVELIFHVFGRL